MSSVSDYFGSFFYWFFFILGNISDSIAQQILGICSRVGCSLEDLSNKWESFAISHPDQPSLPTFDHLEEIKRKMIKEQEKRNTDILGVSGTVKYSEFL